MKQYSLYDYISRDLFMEVSCPFQLQAAFKLVKKNKGVAGIDGIKIEDFELNLEEEINFLSQELREWSYFPQAVRRVEIPKAGSTETRKLGIPCVRDRVLQQSLKMTLEEFFECDFSESSFGFRPNRGQQDAIKQAKLLVNSGKEWIVDLDLEKFFDKMNQDKIIHLLGKKVNDARILKLVGMTLRCGIMSGNTRIPSQQGSVQGSPLSPLLSNIVLDELDKELERRGLEFCRYADDCNIFVGSKKAAERVMNSTVKYIEHHLKLPVNRQKSKVGLSSQIKFLGITILRGMVVIASATMKRALEKVKELTPLGNHLPIEARIKKINQWYQGWAGYYRVTELPSQLSRIEAHIRRRLRSQFVGEQKRRKHLYQKLKKLGTGPKLAKNV